MRRSYEAEGHVLGFHPVQYAVEAPIGVYLVKVAYRKAIPGALVLQDVDPPEDSPDGVVDDGPRLLLDDDRVYSEGLAVQAVFKLKAQAVPIGIQGQLDDIAKSGVPGYGLFPGFGFFAGDGSALLIVELQV
jgi:hypothetical protein